MALYPGSIYPKPGNLRDEIDVVLAEHVNDLRDEVMATQKAIGVNPQISPARTGPPDLTSGRVWGSLTERIANIEASALRDLDSLYVKTSGGSVVRGTTFFAPASGSAIEVLKPGSAVSSPETSRFAVKLDSSGEVSAATVTAAKASLSGVKFEAGTVTAGATVISGSGVSLTNLVAVSAQITGGELKLGVTSTISSSGIVLGTDVNITGAGIITRQGNKTVRVTADGVRVQSGTSVVLDLTPTALKLGKTVLDQSGLKVLGSSGAQAQLTATGLQTTSDFRITGKTVTIESQDKVRITGGLELPDDPTYYWEAPSTVYLGTRPQTSAPSDLKPTYYDGLYSAPNAGAGLGIYGFQFFAPKSGHAKITLQAELSGNVSRSALSFAVVDMTSQQVVFPFDNRHAISLNAPVATQASDNFYAKLSDSAVVSALVPGRRYALLLGGQRAVPGNDAAGPYFPGHPNYPPGYPWGRFFAVQEIQVVIEPVFARAARIEPV